MNVSCSLIHEPKQAHYGNPTILNLIHKENSLSPLKEMHFANGVLMECQVTPLVPIEPLVPMDDRNTAVLNLAH